MSYNQYRPYGFGGLPMVVKNLLIINGLVFLFTLFIAEKAPRITELLVVHYFQSDNFRPHQLVTAIFMHAGFGHLLGNMLGLWIFGSMLERTWGPKRFLIFYLVCGIGANLCDQMYLYFKFRPALDELNALYEAATSPYHVQYYSDLMDKVKNSYASLGASGSIYGLLMGAALLFPNTELYIYFVLPVKMKYIAIIYGFIELSAMISAVPGDNVAHLVHLGGMLFGFILIKVWSRNRQTFW